MNVHEWNDAIWQELSWSLMVLVRGQATLVHEPKLLRIERDKVISAVYDLGQDATHAVPVRICSDGKRNREVRQL